MSKLSPARKLALDVLMEADRRGMYARDVLSSRASAKAIDQRDSAFAARLRLIAYAMCWLRPIPRLLVA